MDHCGVGDAQSATAALRCHVYTAKQSCETPLGVPMGPGSQRSMGKGKGCSGEMLQDKPSREAQTTVCSPQRIPSPFLPAPPSSSPTHCLSVSPFPPLSHPSQWVSKPHR